MLLAADGDLPGRAVRKREAGHSFVQSKRVVPRNNAAAERGLYHGGNAAGIVGFKENVWGETGFLEEGVAHGAQGGRFVHQYKRFVAQFI